MEPYKKILNIYRRDPETEKILYGEFSVPEFEYLKDNIWLWTEKINGMNIRVMWIDGKIIIKGRNEKSELPEFLCDSLGDIFSSLIEDFRNLFDEAPVCLYGEGYGARINKGEKYIKDTQSFDLFDIKIGRYWLKRDDLEDIAQSLGIGIVPVVGIGTLDEARALIATGLKSRWGNFVAEGLVAKPIVEMRSRNPKIRGRIITKIKSKDFGVHDQSTAEPKTAPV